MKRKLFSIIAVVLTVCTFAGCGQVIDNDVPPGREVINISVFSGGFGVEWLDDMLSSYNQSIEKYWFKRLPAHKEDTEEETVPKILAGVSEADVFFTDSAEISPLIAGEYLEDLSPVYNFIPEGESRKIQEKVNAYDLYSSVFVRDGAAYAMPYTEGLMGLVVDYDLLKGRQLLLTDSSTRSGLSKGRDGVEGTYDDGFPVTYSEYIDFFEDIKVKTLQPVVYYDSNMESFAEGIWAQYEGIKNYEVSFTYKGNYTLPSDPTVSETITPETGYKMFSQYGEGRFKAAQLLKDVFLNSRYMYNNDGLTYTDVQGTFIMSHVDPSPVSMIVEGTWWENEAKPLFEADARNTTQDYTYGKRDFRLMPFPSMDGESAESRGKSCFAANRNGIAFALKQDDREKAEAILDFLKAFASDKWLKNFTKLTGTKLPYDYVMTTDELNGLTPFARNVFEIMTSESTVIVRPNLLKQLSPYTKPARWDCTINTAPYKTLLSALKAGSLQNYSDSIKAMYSSANWGSVTVKS